MVYSTDPVWLQTAFDTLTVLFDWVGLKNNVRKTVGLVCHPCQAVRIRSDEAYTRKMTGLGRYYKKRQREWVRCHKCGKDLARGPLSTHCHTKHGVAKGVPVQEGEGEGRGDDPRT